MVKELTCINCPLGCSLTVTLEGDKVTDVKGNTCPRGEAYAKKEVTNPTRIVTSTVRVTGGTKEMINVKTEHDIPKGLIFDVTSALKGVEINAPVSIGDIVLKDVCGTGVNIVAAGNVPLR